jgi:hypothetical protein
VAEVTRGIGSGHATIWQDANFDLLDSFTVAIGKPGQVASG